MSCLDVPDYQNVAKHLKKGESLYCADHLSSDRDMTAAVEACEDPNTGVPGGAMNTNCMGEWHATVDGLPSQKMNYTDDGGNSSDTEPAPFCKGGTSMYMDGFNWNSMVCVIYLFPSWVLDTRAKLIVASIGTFFFGVTVEGVIHARKVVLKQLNGGLKRLGISTVIYGVQLTLAYMIMLVVMTYSGPLFMATILGLMGGHFLFHLLAKDYNSSALAEGATPCCQNEIAKTQRGYSGGTVQEVCPCDEGMSSTIAIGVMDDDMVDPELVPVKKSCYKTLVEVPSCCAPLSEVPPSS